MKKSAVFGAITGVGMMMMIVSGKKCPGLDWNTVALIVGTALTTLGMSHVGGILKEVMDAQENNRYATVDHDDPVVRPFGLPDSKRSRAGVG